MINTAIDRIYSAVKGLPLYAVVLFILAAVLIASPLVDPQTTGAIAEYTLLISAIVLAAFRWGRDFWELADPLAEHINSQRKEVTSDERTEEAGESESSEPNVGELPSAKAQS